MVVAKDTKFPPLFELPKVDVELINEIKIENQVFNVTILSGKVYSNGNLLASCEMKVFIGEE